MMSYEEFCARVPVIDWARLRFELDFSRTVAPMSGRPISLSSRVWGVLFALRLRVPDANGRFDRGFGSWCLPLLWHRVYYARRARAEAARQAAGREVAGGTPIPLGPQPRDFSPQQIRKLRRIWRAFKRDKARAAVTPPRAS